MYVNALALKVSASSNPHTAEVCVDFLFQLLFRKDLRSYFFLNAIYHYFFLCTVFADSKAVSKGNERSCYLSESANTLTSQKGINCKSLESFLKSEGT